MDKMIRWFALFLGIGIASAADAHTGLNAGGSLTAGLSHPFSGLDHFLAMVAVGLWAAQLGGRQLIAVPAAFVSCMALGALAGALGAPMPYVDSAVVFSVLALGLLVAFSVSGIPYWRTAIIAVFGLFHGHAHGAEMPALAQPWQYFGGFLLATAALHALGVGIGLAFRNRTTLLRACGAAISVFGVCLILAT